LLQKKGHGFIAPPTLADINKDGYVDIIAITHGSKAVAIDEKIIISSGAELFREPNAATVLHPDILPRMTFLIFLLLSVKAHGQTAPAQ
jgi:hypothetical protein